MDIENGAEKNGSGGGELNGFTCASCLIDSGENYLPIKFIFLLLTAMYLLVYILMLNAHIRNTLGLRGVNWKYKSIHRR